jgi:hypothetical protein
VLFRRLESQAKLAIEVAVGFIDDNLRVLPAFLRRPLRRIPSVVILLGLVGFLVLVVVLIVLLASGTDNDVRKESSRVASVSAAPAPPQAPSASGAAPPAASHAAASREAVALAEQELKAGNLAGVVKAIEAALAVDPAVRENARVAQILGEAARRRASSGTAFRLLTGPMREEGATVVYDLAAGAKTPDELRAKAEEWLGSEAFRQVAPPPLAIAAELRTARGCKAKRALLERAAAIGDARTLDYLKILAIEGGCGRRGREDCFPCLREDDALAKTMATIQERLTQTPKAP